MPPSIDNLRESTHRVVRLVALGHLADAASARDRLASSADPEALHDFRVALRRLRSWERAFRGYTRGDLSRKLRRRLRDLARDTGASRDLEVHVAWLADQRDFLRRTERPGLRWLLARLEQRKAEADALLDRDIDARFTRLRHKLERALASYREELQLDDAGHAAPPSAFAGVLAARVQEAASELRDQLGRVRSAKDERDAHQARIAAKRLRYLLEPVSTAIPEAAALVERLKSLQDVLGDLHDAHVFGAEIGALAGRSEARDHSESAANAEPVVPFRRTTVGASATGPAARPAPAPAPLDDVSTDLSAANPPGAQAGRVSVDVPASDPPRDDRAAVPANAHRGLEAIAARLRTRADAAFEQYSDEWLANGSAAFAHDVDAVIARVAASATHGVEIERKYLLRFLPDEARDGRRADVDQGYLPGERLHERVRRVVARHPSGRKDVRYFRTVKLGAGLARTEIEEETTAEIFDALWPLTKGHRLRKRRYAVDVGDRTWEIDDFRSRDLVLAEIELGSESERVVIPDWLAGAVEREVTGEPAYLNINLAR